MAKLLMEYSNNIPSEDTLIKLSFLHGECDVFAYALAKLKGLKIYALVEDRFIDGEVLEGLIHAFCLPKIVEGEITYLYNEVIDASGRRDFEDILVEYDVSDVRVVECTFESILRYGEYHTKNKELLPTIFEKAKVYIEKFPDLFE